MLFLRLILLSLLTVLPVAAQTNTDYRRGRDAEASGDIAKATASYQAVVTGNSVLKEYALWRLARIARATGDLPLERERLRQFLATAPSSMFAETAAMRLAQSFFESGDFQAAADSARSLSVAKNATLAREALLLTGESLARAGKNPEAIRAAKKMLNDLMGDAGPALLAESVEQKKLIGRPNQREAVRANIEKRAPKFVDV